jgi:hypothetical protein
VLPFLSATSVVNGTEEGQPGYRARRDITMMLNTFLTPAVNNTAAGHERFWADDLVYTSSAGLVKSKADILKSFAEAKAKTADEQAKPGPVFTAEDVLVRPYGDAAALTFRLAERDPDGKVTYFRNSGMFLRRNGEWRVVTWQATRVTESK